MTTNPNKSNNEQQQQRPTIALDNSKAGMAGVDKEHVEAIINRVSEGTPFYLNEQRKALLRQQRIDAMLKKAHEFDNGSSSSGSSSSSRSSRSELQRAAVDKMVSDIEQEKSSHIGKCLFVHLDMDMFFAAVEERLDPSLKGKPFGVGGMGMLSTSNYEARKYGVRAAMPGYIGKKLCPALILVRPHYDTYREAAEQVRAIVAEYDPEYQSGGLDELTMNALPYLKKRRKEEKKKQQQQQQEEGSGDEERKEDDETDELRSYFSDAGKMVAEMRERIASTTLLTASCGIAPTPSIAKIVSNYNKPNGQYTVEAATANEITGFMEQLPVRSVPGVGKVQELFLHALGIATCGEIFEQRVKLHHVFTPKTFEWLLAVSLGAQSSFCGFGESGQQNQTTDDEDANGGATQQQQSSVGRKSLSQERTFWAGKTAGEILTKVSDIAEHVANGLTDEGLISTSVTIKVKFKSFQVRQFSQNLPRATDDAEQISSVALNLAQQHIIDAKLFAQVRLLGVKCGSLSEATAAAIASDDEEKKKKKAAHHHSFQPTLSQLLDNVAKSKKEKKRARATEVITIDDEEDQKEEESVASIHGNSDSLIQQHYDDVDDDVVIIVDTTAKPSKSATIVLCSQ